MNDKVVLHEDRINEIYIYKLDSTRLQARTKERVPLAMAPDFETMAKTVNLIMKKRPYIMYLHMF